MIVKPTFLKNMIIKMQSQAEYKLYAEGITVDEDTVKNFEPVRALRQSCVALPKARV